jgi:hypothetical protein
LRVNSEEEANTKMSEARRNDSEIRGAWCGFIGSLLMVLTILEIAIGNLSILSPFPGSYADYAAYFTSLGRGDIAQNLLVFLPLMYWLIFAVGIIGILFSLFRTNIGIRISGLFLLVSSVIALILLFSSLGVLSNQIQLIEQVVTSPQELATYGITFPYGIFWPSIILTFIWLFGSFFMIAAAPFNEAKFRTRRMKTLARADTAERAGRPEEAIRLYTYAANLSMKLREEDKASEYFAKSREIREVAIQAILEAEEKRKREELSARRAKLEEQRREILMRADKAEESEDWARAAVIYKEAASLSVDLGEKKLAAQFTAKSKELQKKAKKGPITKEPTGEQPPPPPEA